jgi:hypothetical protein
VTTTGRLSRFLRLVVDKQFVGIRAEMVTSARCMIIGETISPMAAAENLLLAVPSPELKSPFHSLYAS